LTDDGDIYEAYDKNLDISKIVLRKVDIQHATDVFISKTHSGAIVAVPVVQSVFRAYGLAKNMEFSRFVGSSEYADAVLVLDDGQRVFAHQILLAARSSYFRSLLCSTDTKKEEGLRTLPMTGTSKSVLMSVLTCIQYSILYYL
jgi:hypothetical protein